METAQAEIEIRPYQAKDEAACLIVFDSNIPTYFMQSEREEFIEWLEKPDRGDYYVLTKNEEIVACGGIYMDNQAHTAGLAWGMVRQDLHKQGLGKALSLYRLKAISEKYPDLQQQLVTSQHTAAFYEKLGFQTIEITKDGFGPGLDNYKMVK